MNSKGNKAYSRLKVFVLDAASRQILPVLKQLHDMGCDITTYCTSKWDNGYVSRYPNHRILSKDIRTYYSKLIDQLQKGKYDILLPLSDSTMDMATQHYEELSRYVRLPIPSREVFMRAYNKQRTMEICMDEGIPCPITMREGENVDQFVDKIGLPLIAKPRMANGSRGLKIIRSREKLHEYLADGTIKLEEYVLQEFIPQTGKQYNIHLFRDDKKALNANLVTEKVRWYPVDGGASCLCRTSWDQTIANNCQKLLDAVNWRSYCEIEMIVDPRDGIAKVMEINGRASASIKIMDLAGINVAEQMIQLALGEPVTQYDRAKDDIRLRCMMTDILWLLQSPDRFQRKPSWFSPVRTRDALFSAADPLPSLAYIIRKIPDYHSEMQKRKRD